MARERKELGKNNASVNLKGVVSARFLNALRNAHTESFPTCRRKDALLSAAASAKLLVDETAREKRYSDRFPSVFLALLVLGVFQVPSQKSYAACPWASFYQYVETLKPAETKKNMRQGFDFYRIIHSSIVLDQYLRLPPVFVQKFGADLSEVATLKVPDGNTWSVELRKTNGNLLLCNGWKEFVQYYSISVGHFLVFKYNGESDFHVLIFDMSGCEIIYPDYRDDHEQPDYGSEESDAEIFGSSVSAPIPQKVNAPHAVSNDLKFQNPFIKVVMKSSYVDNGYLAIPMNFARRYLKGGLQILTLEVSADQCEGCKWEVGFRFTTNHAHFSKGWTKFVRGNGLIVGDVCVFEMIKKSLLKVHIFRSGIDMMPKVLTMDDRQESLPEEEESSFVFKGGMKMETPKGLKLKHPSFTVRMKSSSVNQSVSVLRLGFAKRYLNDSSGSTKLKVSGRRSWNVKYIVYKQAYARFTSGWAKFARDNNLKEGDVCVFELIKTKEIVFKVHIFPQKEERIDVG